MSPSSPTTVIQKATVGMRRSALRRQLQSVVSDKSTTLSLDLDQPGLDVGAVIEEITRGLTADSLAVQRLVVALRKSCAAELLASRDRGVSDAAARALGKTGGRNSASALVLAIQRRGLNRRLVAE